MFAGDINRSLFFPFFQLFNFFSLPGPRPGPSNASLSFWTLCSNPLRFSNCVPLLTLFYFSPVPMTFRPLRGRFCAVESPATCNFAPAVVRFPKRFNAHLRLVLFPPPQTKKNPQVEKQALYLFPARREPRRWAGPKKFFTGSPASFFLLFFAVVLLPFFLFFFASILPGIPPASAFSDSTVTFEPLRVLRLVATPHRASLFLCPPPHYYPPQNSPTFCFSPMGSLNLDRNRQKKSRSAVSFFPSPSPTLSSGSFLFFFILWASSCTLPFFLA